MYLTQSKSKTPITRSVHGKFNCITVKYNDTRHGIYTKTYFYFKLCSLLTTGPFCFSCRVQILLPIILSSVVSTNQMRPLFVLYNILRAVSHVTYVILLKFDQQKSNRKSWKMSSCNCAITFLCWITFPVNEWINK